MYPEGNTQPPHRMDPKKLATAIVNKNVPKIRSLVEGKNFEGKDDGGVLHYDHEASKYYDTAASLAVESGNIEILKLIVNAGFDLDATTYPLEETPLTIARKAKRNDMVQILLEGGATDN